MRIFTISTIICCFLSLEAFAAAALKETEARDPKEELTEDLADTYAKSPEVTLSQTILGKGAYGVVFLASCGGRRVAVKQAKQEDAFQKSAQAEQEIHEFLQEKKGFSHAHIIRLLHSYSPQANDLHLVFELCHRNLCELLSTQYQDGFSLPLITACSEQLLLAAKFLADQGVLHGDIKPENILLVHPVEDDPKKACFRLADFGIASKVEKQRRSIIQSLWYRAPEVLLGNFPYSPKADLWSIACVIAECLSGQVLFITQVSQDESLNNSNHFHEIKEVLNFSSIEDEGKGEGEGEERPSKKQRQEKLSCLLVDQIKGFREEESKQAAYLKLDFWLRSLVKDLDPEERPTSHEAYESFAALFRSTPVKS